MLNPKEEAKFKELKDKCRELKVPAPPEIFIGLQVHDKNGVLVFDDKQRGHSWTRNFWNALFSAASTGIGDGGSTFSAGYMSLKAYGGNVYAGQAYANMAVGSMIGTSSLNGILVGTGDTAFSVDQYALATQIAHGNAASQLYYQNMAASAPAYTAGTKTWETTHSRVFNNNSGGSITVKEVGIQVYMVPWTSGSSGDWYYMIERSVLDPTVAVANGAQLTVTYEISMDFSAID